MKPVAMCLWEGKEAREMGKRWTCEVLKGPAGDSRRCRLVKLHGIPISSQFMDERADGHFFRPFIFLHIDKPEFVDVEQEEG